MGKTNSFEEVEVKCIGEGQNNQSIIEISTGGKSQLFEALLFEEWGCGILAPCESDMIKTHYEGNVHLCKSHSYYLGEKADGTCKERISLEDYLKQIGYL